MSLSAPALAPTHLAPRVMCGGVLLCVALLGSCGGSAVATTTTSSTTTSSTTNAYAAAYAKATFASGVTVSYPSSCAMTIAASGVPYQHQAYYLAPVSAGGTVVATSPSGIQLGVIAYAGSGISQNVKTVSATFNTCPTKASTTTATGNGPIGFIFSGTVLFDAYEATSTVALGDNVSYTFASTACGGTTCTAAFLDPCNQHTSGGGGGSTWHYHGVPTCWTSVADGASGPSHIIGIALDGYPIYGGYDASGKVVDPTTLDTCNGITSATPEFPSGAYHYVLPVDASGKALTTKQSSIGCYAGTVSASLSAAMKKLQCKMPFLLASGKMRLPDGREVSREESYAWMREAMPEMQMAEMVPAKSRKKRAMDMPGM